MIGYAGLSHLGLVSSVVTAAKGFDVISFDEDTALVRRLNAGDLPVMEPGLSALMEEQRSRLTFTSEAAVLGRCDVIYVAVDVPTDDQDRSDVEPVRHLLQVVAAVAAPGAVIVVLSQVPPGFCRAEQAGVEARGPQLYYQVETLIFGRAVERALQPERFIVGCADAEAPLPPALESHLRRFGCPILPMRYESAELSKICINLFLVSSVATTNMLAEACEVIGAEWREIAPALRLDARIGPHAYLTPGLGIAGGNLRRDLLTFQDVARQAGTRAALIDEWLTDSQYRRDWALRELRSRVLSRHPTPVLALWGLAYKENTNVTKNSPALSLLQSVPDVSVRAYDPGVPADFALAPHVRRVASPLDACTGADALVIMTAWPEFSIADLTTVRTALRLPVVIDPWGVIDRVAAQQLAFEHVRIGTGRSGAIH